MIVMRTGVVRGMFSQPRLDGMVVLRGGDVSPARRRLHYTCIFSSAFMNPAYFIVRHSGDDVPFLNPRLDSGFRTAAHSLCYCYHFQSRLKRQIIPIQPCGFVWHNMTTASHPIKAFRPASLSARSIRR